MSDWTSGYVADVNYTYGYYQELNPLRVRMAFLDAGLVPPAIGHACELGFGQGLSANIHASAAVTSWCGTDFNPAQAAFAQDLAAAADSGARWFDEAFEQFCQRDDLPDFDYIGLHGIWSWVSDANRRVIVDFLKRKLKVGGVLYISYNSQPGQSSIVPLRHLLTEHADVMGVPGQGIVARIDAAIEFVEKLIQLDSTYARANPTFLDRLKKMKTQDKHYLAHEYFNRDWLPMHFSEMAATLADAKLSYACSAHYLDHIEGINFKPDQSAFLKSIPDPLMRETTRDFIVNQQFRRDYWVKGARTLSKFEKTEQILAQSVVLVTPRAKVKLSAAGALGEGVMEASAYAPLLDLMADHKVRTVGEIANALAAQKIPLHYVTESVMILMGKYDMAAAQSAADIAAARPRTAGLNARLIQRARSMNDIVHLASPVTGGGVMVPRFEQLFMLARSHGMTTPQQWADFTAKLLSSQSQRLLVEGNTLATPEDDRAELLRQAQEFADERLAMLQALGIAD